jgi:Bacterial SH3 domain
MLFILGHGGHGGRSSPALIAPLIERSPFPGDPEMKFRVGRTDSCLNLRPAPGRTSTPATCLADGTQVRLDPEGQPFNGAPADALKYTYSTSADGDWVMVATPGGQRGWVSASYLEWDES